LLHHFEKIDPKSYSFVQNRFEEVYSRICDCQQILIEYHMTKKLDKKFPEGIKNVLLSKVNQTEQLI
jgi:hypothetical protein